MKRWLVLIGLVFVLSVGVWGTAAADVSSLTLDSKAILSADKTAAVATGTIVCASGDTVDLQVVILQTSGQVNTAGAGDNSNITCTGDVQTWSATVNVVVGSAFKRGPATALISAFDNITRVSFPPQTQGIKLG